jgi:hypothetical protein
MILGLDLGENAKDLKSFIVKNGINFTNAIVDENLSKLFDVEAIPTTFVIDPTGMCIKVFVGGITAEDLKPYIK